MPQKFKLSQNFPNPFNPTTIIKYSIPKQDFVELKVYNILGNEIALIINEEHAPGEYQIEFDASSVINGLQSGVYFYSLQVDNSIQAKKMILLK